MLYPAMCWKQRFIPDVTVKNHRQTLNLILTFELLLFGVPEYIFSKRFVYNQENWWS